MTKKAIKLNMFDLNGTREWVVYQVKNTTQFHPGQKLNQQEVDELCQGTKFDVTIVKGGK
jgi:hypothetical protein